MSPPPDVAVPLQHVPGHLTHGLDLCVSPVTHASHDVIDGVMGDVTMTLSDEDMPFDLQLIHDSAASSMSRPEGSIRSGIPRYRSSSGNLGGAGHSNNRSPGSAHHSDMDMHRPAPYNASKSMTDAELEQEFEKHLKEFRALEKLAEQKAQEQLQVVYEI